MALCIISQQVRCKNMGVEAECHRCGYEWEYTGSRQYASCPNCRTSVTLGEFGGQSQQGVSSSDAVSEQEFSELQEQVEQNAQQLDALMDHILDLENQVDQLGASSELEGAVVEEQIGELYDQFEELVKQLEGTVEFDHRDASVYDPTEEFEDE